MLSYRHAFHAGNHADVLKHIVLVECLSYLGRKETPYLYVDTHAGAGSYKLTEGYAARTGEWEDGLERLRAFTLEETPPPAVVAYLEAIDRYRAKAPDGATRYPGSPALAAALMRSADRAVAFELHTTDAAALAEEFSADRRFRIRSEDGFGGLRSVLPPASRRGLVLIDPSYELASDYDRVVDMMETALARFATGVYLVWYPLLERSEAKALPGRLAALGGGNVLNAILRIRPSDPGEWGLSGSGLFVINAPWPLRGVLETSLPYLARALGSDGASWSMKPADG